MLAGWKPVLIGSVDGHNPFFGKDRKSASPLHLALARIAALNPRLHRGGSVTVKLDSAVHALEAVERTAALSQRLVVSRDYAEKHTVASQYVQFAVVRGQRYLANGTASSRMCNCDSGKAVQSTRV